MALFAAVLVLWVPSAGAGRVVEVSECGQRVAAGARAYLIRDIDCRGMNSEGVILGHRARLELGGYSLLGEPRPSEGSWQGVRCTAGSRCTVAGPGLITGFSAAGVAGTRVRIVAVELVANGRAGAAAYSTIKLRDSLVEDNGRLGVLVGGRLHSKRSVIGTHPEGRLLELRTPGRVCRLPRPS